MAEGWFHCGRCGNLFRDEPGRACPECKSDPVVAESEIAFLQAGITASAEERPGSARESGSGGDLRKPSTRSKGVAVFVTVWVLFLAGVVGLVRLMRGDDETAEVETSSFADSAERQQFYQTAHSGCYETMMSFLREAAAESRSQHVIDPLDTLPLMARAGNRAPQLGEEEKPRSELFDLFESPEGRAVQSAWILPGDERLEMVFVQDEDEEWRIDWKNLVRFSDEPWSLFLSGNGPSVAEFRLLARRRATSTGGQGDVSRLMLLEPRPWEPGKVGLSSPEIRLDPLSDTGLQLKRAFALREAGKEAFGARLTERDPKGMIRVRVVLRRSDEKDEHGEWGFTIEKLLACHWLDFDELGLPEEE